jgi:hypothetical protein
VPADPKYLREHYASLSDDALLATNRDELVDVAQRCYDDELKSRNLAAGRHVVHEDSSDEDSIVEDMDFDPDQPDWMEDGADVFSQVNSPGDTPGQEIAAARDALEAAGIPCHLILEERPEDTTTTPPTNLWRLLVPGELNLRATSVLDRDIFNQDFEGAWKNHLETRSDDELRAMNPKFVFCGLFDRVERVNKAYDDELKRRRLK